MRNDLTRRERQILEILYELGEAPASQVRAALPGEPADATVRTLLRILESKGVVKHRREGKRFVYRPTTSRRSAANSALRRVLDIFFGGRVEEALAAHLADPKTTLNPDQIRQLRAMIDEHAEPEDR